MTDRSDTSHQGAEYPFTRLAHIDSARAEKLRGCCAALAKLGSAGKATAYRIHTVGEDIAIFPPASLQAFIDIEGTGIDVERERLRSTQWVTIARNVCVLLPLIFTWGGLAWAASQYQIDVSAHSADSSQSFLQLWQEGFSARNSVLSFSHFATIDVILFIILIAIGLYADLQARSARKLGAYARRLTTQSFKDLVEVSIKVTSGVNAQTNSQQWAGQVHQVLYEIRAVLERLGQMLSDREGKKE